MTKDVGASFAERRVATREAHPRAGAVDRPLRFLAQIFVSASGIVVARARCMSTTSARKLHLVVDRSPPESERRVSRVPSSATLATTTKIPKVQLDRLRKIRDERDVALAKLQEQEEEEAGWDDEAPTVQAQTPELPPSPPSADTEIEEVEPDDVELVAAEPTLVDALFRHSASCRFAPACRLPSCRSSGPPSCSAPKRSKRRASPARPHATKSSPGNARSGS